MRGEFKRGARPCARFDEKVDERLPAQRRHFLDLARADLFERVGRLQDKIDLVGGKFAQTEQIFACPARSHSLSSQTASGSASVSCRRTWICSRVAVGKFLPT